MEKGSSQSHAIDWKPLENTIRTAAPVRVLTPFGNLFKPKRDAWLCRGCKIYVLEYGR